MQQLSDKLLLRAYQKAIQMNKEKKMTEDYIEITEDFIEAIKSEISKRGLL
ncbi:sporulation histidine kinase inhibitor Sda [Niallia sp. XMNu-256]|uniref:sporulation histidine kinase inhibitor Sda n=1 Tax=Niallia sp. XMNu-256 TaxID=3082444 RepID=UPI0030D45F68